MLGVILYLYFLAVGFLYADMIFRDKGIFFRSWMGGIFGNMLLMTGGAILSFIFGFTHISHIVLVILAPLPYFLIKYRRKESFFRNLTLKGGEDCMSVKMFCALVLPLKVLICLLMANHIYAPVEGGVASGQSTYGDLAMHSGIITSLAEQSTFPPDYCILAGVKLGYPFFIDMLSSSLYLFGLPLRYAILLPSFVFALLLVMGFYYMSYKLTGRKSISVLATLMFFLNGGFGFAYFFEGAKADPTAFTKIFTDYYHTPTNYNEMNIRWANTICDMIIPQRTTMAGWCMLMPALWMLSDAICTKKRRSFVLIGVFAGCMPMIHTHTFMAFGIICAVLFFLYLIDEKSAKDKKQYVINWVIFGAITIAMALPQLIIWTFRQASEGSFLKFQYDWVNANDPSLWFWIKNWGIVLLALVPAFMNADKKMKRLMIAGLVVFAVADLLQFQPLDYDNNKIFFVAYIIAIVAVADFFVRAYERMKEIKGRGVIAAMLCVCLFLSGILTIGREFKSGAQYQTFSDEDLEFAEFVKDNTDPHGVFATHTGHLNSVYVLAGRTVFVGPSNFIWTHGFGDEYNRRSRILNSLYASSDTEELKEIAKENNIKYILCGGSERGQYNVNERALDGLKEIYDKDGIELYEIE